ncbi:hypothetical protein BH11BAC1_BH11BAC1_15860 [soil metagenome]
MKKQSSAYIEMLFENRNKEYGAYDLRVNYEKRLFKSFGLSLLIAGCFFLVPYALTQILREKLKPKLLDDVLVYDFSKTYVIEKELKTETTPTAHKTKAASADATYKVVQKVEEKKIPEEKKSEDPGTSASQGGGTAIGIDSALSGGGNGLEIDSIPSEPMSIASVDFAPEFPGGEDALIKFMAKNTRYPAVARENNITGRVYVCFVINEKGKTENIKIMRSLGSETDEEVLRVIGIMPDWKPGQYHNQNVKTALVMPVSFSLK